MEAVWRLFSGLVGSGFGGEVVGAFLAHHVVGDDGAEVALLVVAGVFPVHCAEEVIVEDIFAFDFDGAGVVVAHNELTFGVGNVGNLCEAVPNDCATVKELEVFVVHVVGIFVCAAAVEGKAEGKFLLRNTGGEMGLESLIGSEGGMLRSVKGRLMLVSARRTDVVAHDVDEVNVGEDGGEVVEAGVAGSGEGERFVGPNLTADVAHEEGVVLGIVGRRGDAGA